MNTVTEDNFKFLESMIRNASTDKKTDSKVKKSPKKEMAVSTSNKSK